MILEGDNSVIEAIKEKKRLMDVGEEHDHIKPMLVIDGGLMKGMYGAGAAIALHEGGYTDVFTSYGGVSSGAVTLAYLITGEVEKGITLATDDACKKEFINFKRFWNTLNPRVFEQFLRGSTGNGLSCEKLLEKGKHFHIGLSEHQTGNPVLYRPKDCDGIYKALCATIAMPGSTNMKVCVDGVRYSDGASTFPLAVEQMIYDIDATHILFITNQDKHTLKIPRMERFINNTFFRHRMPRPLRVAASMRWETRHALVRRVFEDKHKPILFAWGDGSISSFERDPEKAKAVVERSRQWWSKLLV